MNDRMNNFMDDLREKTADLSAKAAAAAKTVGNKAGEAAEVAAVNVKIKKAEGDIRGIYRRLGEAVYKNMALEQAEQEDITPLIAEVDAKNAEIGRYNEEIDAIREKYASKRGENDVEVEFVMEDEEPEEPESEKLCPVCGKAVKAGDTFCSYCGAKL